MTSVAVAMSGGVDSSVAAALLLEQGYEVSGVTLHLWREGQEEAAAFEPVVQARKVAEQLGIPFVAWDARERFKEQVVLPFVWNYLEGATPSPCVTCNRYVKWQSMLDYADAHHIDMVATGHYAQLSKDELGRMHLLKGKDAGKDQAYMLAFLGQEQLSRSIFPIGVYSKPDIREIARKLGLVVADRDDSQDLCFLPSGDYRSFVQENAPEQIQPGEIVNQTGEVLGQHQGLPFYTIGQRKGLGSAAPQPMYVLEKDIANNRLIVAVKDALGKRNLAVGQVNWISGQPPADCFRAEIKIRYRAHLTWGQVQVVDPQTVSIELDGELVDITPGQVAVFYNGDEVLGGGIILRN
jgi:tRNA-specific 2-thiouridylase